MRLILLKPFHFRAFGDNPPITFNNKLTIFYGGNGSGKSSLAEALEWLFYGYTKRRRKGDQYSKNEYKGSYIHKGCPIGVAPFVEAEVLFRDGSNHVLRRTMKKDDRGKISDTDSTLMLDGVDVSDYSNLGITNDAHCPIVVQHGIQDFIHTRPIDRYRIISEALGLADLTKFKDSLEQAKNRFKTNPPQKVTDARASLRKSVKALNEIGLQEIANRWLKGEVEEQADDQSIFKKAIEISSSQAHNNDDLLKDVRNRQALEISKIFDLTPYRPNINLDKVMQQGHSILHDLAQEHGKVLAAAGELTKAIVSKYTDLQLVFWNQGVTIIEQSGDAKQLTRDRFNCPFCNELTLSQEKIIEIRNKVTSSKGVDEKRNQLNNALSDFDSTLGVFQNFWPQLEFAFVPEQQVQSLRKMFNRGEKQLDEFVDENRRVAIQSNLIRNQISTLKGKINDLRKRAVYPEEAVQVIEPLAALVQEIFNAVERFSTGLHKYSAIFIIFQPILQRELSDEKTVAIFTDLVDLLSTKPQIDLVITARKYETQILKCQQVADEYILCQQKTILDDREKDILSWYGRLSPNPDVKFSGLEPGKNEFNLKATAFGQELNAAASLSQSQLNCLGLSVYIPSIVAPNAPFQFIVFDDPVQAMDDDHHEAFLIKVVPELLRELNHQVIILTHLKPTADRLRRLNYDLCPIYYHFDKLMSTGPQIKEYVVLNDEARHIKDLAEGNEASRSLSVDRIRVFCELLMREAHLRIEGIPISDNIQTPRQILQVFRKLKGVTPHHSQLIDDTIGWSDPSHHTDPDWQTPETQDIKMHIERLQSIASAIGLNC